MPAKKNRVNSQLFKKILKEGKKKYTFCLNFFYLLDENEKEFKFSVVIPKKVIKKTVKRNKLKRQVREIIKEYIKSKNIHNIQFIVFVKQNCKDIKFLDLKKLIFKDLDDFLTKT